MTSICLTCLNEVSTIRMTLANLRGQLRVDPYEIVVVDGGSTDGTWEILLEIAEGTPGMRVYRHEEANIKYMPSPVAYGRNRAIGHSRGSIIAVTDAGTIVSVVWLANLLARFSDPSVDVVYGRCYPRQSEVDRSSRNVAFRVKVWDKIPYPQVYLTAEDTFWNDQIDRAGIKWVFEESAFATWFPPESFKGKARMYYRYGKGDGYCRLRGSYYLTVPLKFLHRPWLVAQYAGWIVGQLKRWLA